MEIDKLQYEKELLSQGITLIGGMDEAGRGPLAGAVFTAMVIMPLDDLIEGVDDSKKLPELKREELYEKITQKAIAYSICSADERVIDKINILQATKLSMQDCLKNIKIKPEYCLVDYVSGLNLDCNFKTIVKGDAKSYSVACASILAKVARDRYMKDMAKKYPYYGFEAHKGYGTKLHYQMLQKYGKSAIHRESFLKKWEEFSGK